MNKRLIWIALVSILLILLSLHSVYFHPWIGVAECLQNPDKYDGQLVTHYKEPIVGELYADGFQLLQRHGPSIRVYADTAGLTTGEYIGIAAVFQKEGDLKAVTLHVAKKRRQKIWVSVIPVLLIGFLLTRYFRLNRRNLQIELRKHA